MMKIVHRQPQATADISSARGTAHRELWTMVLSAAALLIVLFFAVGWAVDVIVARISFETEAKIFKQLTLPPGKARDAPSAADVEKAGAILATLQSDPSVPPLPYRLVVIEQPQPNAFAFPGGIIAVTTGLMEVLEEDLALAFVLGHELGHFHNRDHLQGLGRAIGFKIIMAVLFGSGSDSFGYLIENVLQTDYSQESEKAADRFGLELVYRTFGEMEGVDRLFQIILDERKTPEWAYMFSTHPSPAKRIEYLKSYSKALKGPDPS
jgi:Zn-dependent protease with chaperone function